MFAIDKNTKGHQVIIRASDTEVVIENEINGGFVERMAAESYAKNPFASGVENEEISFGIEFEFYLNDDAPEEAIRYLVGQAMSVFAEKIVYLPMSIGEEKQTDTWYVERDLSLDESEYGFEIVSPRFNDIKKLPFYFDMVMGAIKAVGYTTDECGLHVHLSSSSMQDIDLVKALLFMDQRRTLMAWSDRTHYAKDLLKVFNGSDIDIFRRHHNKMSRYYNLNLIENNHIELRCFGGKGYESKPGQIVSDIGDFLEVYRIACTSGLENSLYAKLLDRHAEKIKSDPGNGGLATADEVATLMKMIQHQYGHEKEVAAEIALSLMEETMIVPRDEIVQHLARKI